MVDRSSLRYEPVSQAENDAQGKKLRKIALPEPTTAYHSALSWLKGEELLANHKRGIACVAKTG